MQLLDGEDLQNLTIVNNRKFGFLARSAEVAAGGVGSPKVKQGESRLANSRHEKTIGRLMPWCLCDSYD